jgi:phospholipid/cholesterol/gamma-HCH transport system substrate-binding protein
VNTAVSGVGSVDSALTKTQSFLNSLASDKSGGELLPTVMSMRELVESFNKRSGALMSDGRRMLGDVSASINKADRKIGGR